MVVEDVQMDCVVRNLQIEGLLGSVTSIDTSPCSSFQEHDLDNTSKEARAKGLFYSLALVQKESASRPCSNWNAPCPRLANSRPKSPTALRSDRRDGLAPASPWRSRFRSRSGGSGCESRTTSAAGPTKVTRQQRRMQQRKKRGRQKEVSALDSPLQEERLNWAPGSSCHPPLRLTVERRGGECGNYFGPILLVGDEGLEREHRFYVNGRTFRNRTTRHNSAAGVTPGQTSSHRDRRAPLDESPV